MEKRQYYPSLKDENRLFHAGQAKYRLPEVWVDLPDIVGHIR